MWHASQSGYQEGARHDRVGSNKPPPIAAWAIPGVLSECVKNESWLAALDFEINILLTFTKFIPANVTVDDAQGGAHQVPFWTLYVNRDFDDDIMRATVKPVDEKPPVATFEQWENVPNDWAVDPETGETKACLLYTSPSPRDV